MKKTMISGVLLLFCAMSQACTVVGTLGDVTVTQTYDADREIHLNPTN
jgi:hypothetical protein